MNDYQSNRMQQVGKIVFAYGIMLGVALLSAHCAPKGELVAGFKEKLCEEFSLSPADLKYVASELTHFSSDSHVLFEYVGSKASLSVFLGRIEFNKPRDFSGSYQRTTSGDGGSRKSEPYHVDASAFR